MGRSRYAVQAMIQEHFGMATAEMAAAGVLVFAHDSGGSPEVLGHQRALLWETEQDAIERIATLARDRDAIDGVRARLRRHSQAFAVSAFVDQFRSIVRSAGETPDLP
jgi:glycosyltransferase involved in cell wall biosynthesis